MWARVERVPFERPPEYAGREFLTDAEMAARQEQQLRTPRETGLGERGFAFNRRGRRASSSAADELPPRAAQPGEEDSFARPGRPPPIPISRRTSAVIDPPDGLLPPWTPEQIERFEARIAELKSRGASDTWLQRHNEERCLEGVEAAMLSHLFYFEGAGEPPVVGRYRAEGFLRPKRIVQAPGQVLLVIQAVGLYNVVPLNAPSSPSDRLRQHRGVTNGRWEGDTLVVETTNIGDRQDGDFLPARDTPGYLGSGETLHVIEWFTRVDEDTLEYRVTIDDPAVFTRPITRVYNLTRDADYFEPHYQCYENQQMNSILLAGRVDEEGALRDARAFAEHVQSALDNLKVEWAKRSQARP